MIEGSEAAQELVGLERFDHVAGPLNPELAPQQFALRGRAGHGADRQIARMRNSPQDLDAGELGKVKVEQNQVGYRRFGVMPALEQKIDSAFAIGHDRER